MARQRMTLMCLLVLVGLLGVSGEAMAQGKIAFAATADETGRAEIWISDADGANPVQLTSSTTCSSWGPEFSRDGSEIFFTRSGCGEFSIWRMNADGSGQQMILDRGYAGFSQSGYFEISPPSFSASIPPNVTSLSPFSQTVSAFFLGVIATLMLLRQRGDLNQQT